MNSYRDGVNSFIAASDAVNVSRIYGHKCDACILPAWYEYIIKDSTEHYYLCFDCNDAVEMYREGWWKPTTPIKPQPGVRDKLFADAWKIFCGMVNEGNDITKTNVMLVCNYCRMFRTSFEMQNGKKYVHARNVLKKQRKMFSG